MAQLSPPDANVDEGRPPRRTRRRRWLLRSLAVVVALTAVMGAAAGIYVGWVSKSFTGNVQRKELLPNDPPTLSSPGQEPGEPKPGSTKQNAALNYVLMGSDSRDATNPGAGRSDSLMVLHLDGDRKHAYLISFPRDLYVAIPGHGKNKINAAYALGPQLSVATLEKLLGTQMDHVALIDFEGFIGLTEELGGVTVTNEYATSSEGYYFPIGKITIKGAEALAYVRERHQLPNGDLGRAERQRLVVKAILAKGLSPETISNPTKFTGFVSGVAKHLTVDAGLSDSEIRGTALSLRLTASDLRLRQAPISGFRTIDGASVDVVDRDQMKDLAKALRTDTMADYLGE